MSPSFFDAVKFAGHSCPTVAGAYMMTTEALKVLYPDSIPVRGNIEVHMPDAISHEPYMLQLLNKIHQDDAMKEDKTMFSIMWQQRVEKLFKINPIKVIN